MKIQKIAPFEDDEGIWRVGLRLRDYAPFTVDKKPPMFLPNRSRLTLLLMEHAHQQKHSGVEETVARFRMNGFWTTQAGKVAKSVKAKCIVCRYLDKNALCQTMGSHAAKPLVSPMAWGHIEIDLFGPFSCRSDTNKRSTKKTWAMVIVDRHSGPVHIDIVAD